MKMKDRALRTMDREETEEDSKAGRSGDRKSPQEQLEEGATRFSSPSASFLCPEKRSEKRCFERAGR
jgi:rubredoxin